MGLIKAKAAAGAAAPLLLLALLLTPRRSSQLLLGARSNKILLLHGRERAGFPHRRRQSIISYLDSKEALSGIDPCQPAAKGFPSYSSSSSFTQRFLPFGDRTSEDKANLARKNGASTRVERERGGDRF